MCVCVREQRMETVIYSTKDVWGHPSSLISSGIPRLSQNHISVAMLGDAQREHWVPPAARDTDVSSDAGKQSEKTPKFQPRGSLGSRGNSTEQRGSKKESHPSAGDKQRQCQHHLGLAAATTSSHPCAVSSCPALYPCFIPWPEAIWGPVLGTRSARAADSHGLAFHRKQQHCRITFLRGQNQRAGVSYKTPE